jgi:hypothetical protein
MAYYLNPTSTTSATISVNSTGHLHTTTGTNGVSWYDNSSITANPDLKPSSLQVHGKAVFQNDVSIDGDLEIKGKSIAESLAKIEQRLAIMQPNPELEKRWNQLKELGDQYRALEADILEKEEIMRILKS